VDHLSSPSRTTKNHETAWVSYGDDVLGAISWIERKGESRSMHNNHSIDGVPILSIVSTMAGLQETWQVSRVRYQRSNRVWYDRKAARLWAENHRADMLVCFHVALEIHE